MTLSFFKTAAFAAIASLPIAILCLIWIMIALDFNMDAFSDYSILLERGEQAAGTWRLAMILDLFGYYLLILPIVFVLRNYFKKDYDTDWLNFARGSLVVYSLVGAIGAVMFSAAIPPLLEQYSGSVEPERAALIAVFNSLSYIVYDGLWNILEQLAGGIGWMILGILFLKTKKTFGIYTITLASACLLDSLGSLVELHTLATIGQTVYLVLAPIWAAWIGVIALSKKKF